jgi:hypothetical protein
MARRIKLELEHEWPYRILGITATIQDYRLAHFISQKTGLLFQRQEDLSLALPSKTGRCRSIPPGTKSTCRLLIIPTGWKTPT